MNTTDWVWCKRNLLELKDIVEEESPSFLSWINGQDRGWIGQVILVALFYGWAECGGSLCLSMNWFRYVKFLLICLNYFGCLILCSMGNISSLLVDWVVSHVFNVKISIHTIPFFYFHHWWKTSPLSRTFIISCFLEGLFCVLFHLVHVRNVLGGVLF